MSLSVTSATFRLDGLVAPEAKLSPAGFVELDVEKMLPDVAPPLAGVEKLKLELELLKLNICFLLPPSVSAAVPSVTSEAFRLGGFVAPETAFSPADWPKLKAGFAPLLAGIEKRPDDLFELKVGKMLPVEGAPPAPVSVLLAGFVKKLFFDSGSRVLFAGLKIFVTSVELCAPDADCEKRLPFGVVEPCFSRSSSVFLRPNRLVATAGFELGAIVLEPNLMGLSGFHV